MSGNYRLDTTDVALIALNYQLSLKYIPLNKVDVTLTIAGTPTLFPELAITEECLFEHPYGAQTYRYEYQNDNGGIVEMDLGTFVRM